MAAGKAARTVSRLFGHGGSSLPGRVARRVDPLVLRRLANGPRSGNIVITGTNGKTTTAGLVSAIAEQAGFSLVHNQAGANLISGITAAFVGAASLSGRVNADYGLLEVDEATVPQAVRETRPRAVAVTNFFADQLDRFATLADTVARVRRGIEGLAPESTLVLNADDPEVAQLAAARPGPAVFFGVAPEVVASLAAWNGTGTDAVQTVPQLCGRCGRPLRYDARFYAHLGIYRCPGCGFARPRPDVLLTDWKPEADGGATLAMTTPAVTVNVRLTLPGFYNVYNALAAAAVGAAFGWPPEALAAGLSGYQAGFGRMERQQLGGHEARVALVKNPVGCDEVLRTVLHDQRAKVLLFALNDHAGDGTDIAWIWDAHFEWLATDTNGPAHIVCAGTRAADAAVRLKYAGFDMSRLHVEPNVSQALARASAVLRPGSVLYMLPTYSAMLELRPVLARAGVSVSQGGM